MLTTAGNELPGRFRIHEPAHLDGTSRGRPKASRPSRSRAEAVRRGADGLDPAHRRSYVLLICLTGPMLVSMDLVGGPVGGVDYPRTYQEFRAWFPDDASCAAYL